MREQSINPSHIPNEKRQPVGRIRTIKPQMFTDEDIGDLSVQARWLYTGLFTQADREGKLEDRPRKLKVEVMPYDDVDIEDLLRELTEARFIMRYEVGGKRYIFIRTFHIHQHVNPRESPSRLPDPPSGLDKNIFKYSGINKKMPIRREGDLGREGDLREGKEKQKSTREVASIAAKNKSSPASASELFSDPYLDELQADPAYGKVEVRHVCAKMCRWCKEHGKEPTRERLINWLNREEPRKGNGANDDDRGTSAQAKRVAASLERDN